MVNQLPSFDTSEFKKKKTKYCLVIPVMNEGGKFQKEIVKLKKYSKLIDIIVADGDSTDGSTNKSFLRKNGVRALQVLKGPGKLGTQYRMAFSYILKQGYLGVITMDGNNKDGPAAIPRFIKELDNGYDYIQGSRFIKGGKAVNTPPMRYFGNRFILAPILSMGAGKIYTDTSNGYRAYSKKLLENSKLKLFRDIFVRYEILFYVTARANRLGLKTKEIPVTRSYPKGKIPTKITGLKKQLMIVINAIRASFGYFNPVN